MQHLDEIGRALVAEDADEEPVDLFSTSEAKKPKKRERSGDVFLV